MQISKCFIKLVRLQQADKNLKLSFKEFRTNKAPGILVTLRALGTLKAFRSASKLICCTNSFGEQSHSDLKLLVLCSECVSRLKKSEAPKTFSERVLQFFKHKPLAVLWPDYQDSNKKHSVSNTGKNKPATPRKL